MSIKKAEIQLQNERIRSSNNTISICGLKRDICYNTLKDVLEMETLQE